LRQHVAQSRLEFYYLQQILVWLLVLRRYNLTRNKFEFDACEWLSQSAATRPKENMADGEDEPEIEEGQ